MLPIDRMELEYAANPKIGRLRLQQSAGVSQLDARIFLANKRNKQKDFCDITKHVSAVSLHDWHVPYHDGNALDCAFTFCEHSQPVHIIIHECHDFYTLSRFSKDPDRKGNLQYEIDLVGELLLDLRKRCPKSKIHFLKANHTDRLQKYLWDKAPALSGLRSLRIEELLNLAELDIEYKPHFVYKDFLFKHGNIVRQDSGYTAKAELMREGMSGASGHTHRLGSHYRTLRGGSYVWIEGGCLCDMEPEYLDDSVANWQHGISFVNFERDGSMFIAQPVPIVNGKILWGNEIVS